MPYKPSTVSISGTGLPRLIAVKAAKFYTSVGATTYTSTTVTEADGAATAISFSANSGTAEIQVITITPHGLVAKDWTTIAGHVSTPDINGDRRVLAVLTNFTFIINVGSQFGVPGGTTGTVKRIPKFPGRNIVARMRVSNLASGFAGGLKYGKVTAVAASVLTVDAWRGGTPTNGDVFVVDGWIVDLPRCQSLNETFEPDQLVHNLFRSRKETKFFGYKYRCVLDYSRYIMADTLIDLREQLNLKEDDRLVLIPRADKPNFQYNVYLAEPINLALFGKSAGHKGVTFVLQGKENVNFPTLSGYGFGYGTNYGTQL